MDLGQIGLDYYTFLRLSPEEFNAVYKAWREREEERERGDWHGTRILAVINVSPHCKSKIHPEKLLSLPWDKKKTPAGRTEVITLSREESRERIKRLKGHRE